MRPRSILFSNVGQSAREHPKKLESRVEHEKCLHVIRTDGLSLRYTWYSRGPSEDDNRVLKEVK